MKLRWQLYKKNLGTNHYVAKLLKDDDSLNSVDILKVYQTSNIDFYTKICSDFTNIVEPHIIFHAEISENVDIPSNDITLRDVNISEAVKTSVYQEKCLDYACKEIEKDFNEQTSGVLKLIT